jgi:hypothetical protein
MCLFSGYLHQYGLKKQIVHLPIGILGSVFIAKLRQNDNGVQNIIGLKNYNYLMQLLSCVFIGGLLPYPYCDVILRVLAKILPHYINLAPELQLLNMHLAFLWEWMEYIFAYHCVQFKFLSYHTIWTFSADV